MQRSIESEWTKSQIRSENSADEIPKNPTILGYKNRIQKLDQLTTDVEQQLKELRFKRVKEDSIKNQQSKVLQNQKIVSNLIPSDSNEIPVTEFEKNGIFREYKIKCRESLREQAKDNSARLNTGIPPLSTTNAENNQSNQDINLNCVQYPTQVLQQPGKSEMQDNFAPSILVENSTEGVTSHELEILRRYTGKLQTKMRDLKRVLAEKNLQIQDLSKKDGIASALLYEAQIDQLRSTLAIREQEKQHFLKLLGDLERRISCNNTDCELIQFVQDQSRQFLLVKRANLEMQRRQRSCVHQWTRLENENRLLDFKVESLERRMQEQKDCFTACLIQRDQKIYDTNRILSDILHQGGVAADSQSKKLAVEHLISSLQTSMQSELKLKERIIELEQELYNSVSASEASRLSCADEEVAELKDIIKETYAQQSLRRMSELEALIDVLYSNLELVEKKKKLVEDQISVMNASPVYRPAEVIKELSMALDHYKRIEAENAYQSQMLSS